MRTALLLLVGCTLSGCGLVLTHGPPAGYEHLTEFSCTSGNAGPIIDAIVGSAYALTNSARAFTEEDTYYAKSDQAQLLLTGLVGGVFLGVSSAIGFEKTAKCRAAKQQLAARQELAHAAGGAPGLAPPTAPVDSVRISPAASTIRVGSMVALTATAYAGNGVIRSAAFRWSSSDEAVAWVTRTGVVEAQAPGRVVIAANANNVVGIATVVVAP